MSKMKFGIAPGPAPEITVEGAFSLGTILPAKSGRFVCFDISNTYWRAVATNETAITGYVDESVTTSATLYDKLPIVTNISRVVFEIPYASAEVAGTLTQAIIDANIGLLGDLYVDGNGIQYCDIASTQDLFHIVGGSVENQVLYVTVADSKINQIA